jgi:hypothetical protein
MVVLRCTQQLLRRLRSAPATVVPASTTRLGDWYGTAFQVGSRRYGLFIAERTRLPIVLDATELRRVAAALPKRLAEVLAILGVDAAATAEEQAAMGEAMFAATRSRSLLGSLNDFAFMTRAGLVRSGPLSPLDLSLDLAETPLGPLQMRNAGDATVGLLGRRADLASAEPMELAVVRCGLRTAWCRRLAGGSLVTLRTGRFWDLVPGEVIVVRPTSEWSDAGLWHVAGEVLSTRVDAKALGLTPLRMQDLGPWDPAEQYWGEEGEPIEDWARPIIARGPRPSFEMEQVLPGFDPDEPDDDPICRSIELKDAGDRHGARQMLMGLCEADLRCLDAHAHLGNLAFDAGPESAVGHYEVGVRIGELSLGEGFDGVLPWGWIDNRPFLRCLYGYGLCLWRLELFDEAAQVFDRILWLNPSDNQGARFVIDAVRTRHPWTPDLG